LNKVGQCSSARKEGQSITQKIIILFITGIMEGYFCAFQSTPVKTESKHQLFHLSSVQVIESDKISNHFQSVVVKTGVSFHVRIETVECFLR
jgi:glutaredoxin-related protein